MKLLYWLCDPDTPQPQDWYCEPERPCGGRCRWVPVDGGDAMKLRKHVLVLSGYVASQDRERGSVVSADRSPPDGEKVGGPGDSARGEAS